MKKETVQKSHEMYKKKIEEKKLADEMIIHDIHLTPMIFDADSSFYYTYFQREKQSHSCPGKAVFLKRPKPEKRGLVNREEICYSMVYKQYAAATG